MSQSGHQHPKADNGGQRSADSKKADEKHSAEKESTEAAADVGKPAGSGGKKDAKR